MIETCPACGADLGDAERFACTECGRPQALCARCQNIINLFEDVSECELCGPSRATPEQLQAALEAARRMGAGLRQGREEMQARSGVAYDHHKIISQAWIAAGRPRRGDPDWRKWLGTKYQLRRSLGMDR